jgi:glucosamine--fructose-6-phosphate aminotransferase (isomerizing)
MRKTLQEILFQPTAWQNTLTAFSERKKEVLAYLEKHRNAELVLTGCGTSYYLPLTAAALYTKFTGEKARGIPASEIMLFPQSIFARNRDYLLVPISRSGKTPETLAATRYAKEVLGSGTLLISCTDGSEISNFADLTLICPEAAEKTKYMTKSFTSMLFGFQLITAWKSGNQQFEKELLQLPRNGERLINQYQPIMEKLANSEDFKLYIYLGHGPMFGIAEESMLKLKEMACTPAEAYHGMELMHGPKYAVNDKTLIFYLLSDSAREQEIGLLKRIKDWGGNIKIICEEKSLDVSEVASDVFELRSGLSENARPILVMLLTQLYGYYRALVLGKDIK